MTDLDLRQYGLGNPRILRNPSPASLYQHALADDADSALSDTGALIAMSGEKTGRSPGDKRIVDEAPSRDHVWWGDINIPLESDSFEMLREEAINYLDSHDRLFVVDGYAGWDKRHQVKVRVICERAYHALFMHNMLIRPSRRELSEFGSPDYTIYAAGQLKANTSIPGVSSHTSVSLSLERGEMVLMGTEYAGELKKGVFTIMNYIMPKNGVLSMHCSANEGPEGDVSVFFGLSGTGKTTLSADPHRNLIGDDEHCWTDDGVFNIEGGCYAKVIELSAEAEPQIYNAIRFGALLENVVHDPATGAVDYSDNRLTDNTRCAYPVEHIPNAKIPGLGGMPQNVILLTCDAFSVLPPVSHLSAAQAMYYYISGYTAKVAGTEMGVTEPQATFSACFGAPFLVWHPTRYAEMLAERIRAHGSDVWMVNTGWSGGPYGVGSRMPISYTRAIIDAIHDGSLAQAPTTTDPVFGLSIPTQCPGVPDEVLVPENTWPDTAEYHRTAQQLAEQFRENFRQYEDQASAEIRQAGPSSEYAGPARASA